MVTFDLSSAHVAIASLLPCALIALVTPGPYLAPAHLLALCTALVSITVHIKESATTRQTIPDHLKVPLIIGVTLWLTIMVRVFTLSKQDIHRYSYQQLKTVKGSFLYFLDQIIVGFSSFFALSAIAWITSMYTLDRQLLEQCSLMVAFTSILWAVPMVCKWFLEYYLVRDATKNKTVETSSKESATAATSITEHAE